MMALPGHDWVLEDDRLFDDPSRQLAARDHVLRLRLRRPLSRSATGGCVLTFKGPARIEQGHRVREEIELTASDPEAATLLFARLGYAPSFRYQKLRRTLRMPGLVACLDETPMGPFVELEGDAGAVDLAAGVLGAKRSDYVTASYPALWRALRGEPVPPMVFGGNAVDGEPSKLTSVFTGAGDGVIVKRAIGSSPPLTLIAFVLVALRPPASRTVRRTVNDDDSAMVKNV